MALQSLSRAASLGQLARVTAQAVPGAQALTSSVQTSVRSIHAGNVDVPDFSYYRRSAVQSPSAKSGESAADRMSYRFCLLMITFRGHLFNF